MNKLHYIIVRNGVKITSVNTGFDDFAFIKRNIETLRFYADSHVREIMKSNKTSQGIIEILNEEGFILFDKPGEIRFKFQVKIKDELRKRDGEFLYKFKERHGKIEYYNFEIETFVDEIEKTRILGWFYAKSKQEYFRDMTVNGLLWKPPVGLFLEIPIDEFVTNKELKPLNELGLGDPNIPIEIVLKPIELEIPVYNMSLNARGQVLFGNVLFKRVLAQEITSIVISHCFNKGNIILNLKELRSLELTEAPIRYVFKDTDNVYSEEKFIRLPNNYTLLIYDPSDYGDKINNMLLWCMYEMQKKLRKINAVKLPAQVFCDQDFILKQIEFDFVKEEIRELDIVIPVIYISLIRLNASWATIGVGKLIEDYALRICKENHCYLGYESVLNLNLKTRLEKSRWYNIECNNFIADLNLEYEIGLNKVIKEHISELGRETLEINYPGVISIKLQETKSPDSNTLIEIEYIEIAPKYRNRNIFNYCVDHLKHVFPGCLVAIKDNRRGNQRTLQYL